MKLDTYERDSEVLAAVFYGDYHRATELIARFYELDARDGEGSGWTFLHWAVQEGHTNILHWLLERGADPEEFGRDCITPFSIAVSIGNLRFLKIMRRYGAEINGVPPHQNVPLIDAVAWKHSKCVRYLLLHGADVNAKDVTGTTALVMAVHHGHHGLARYLLHKGAHIDVRDEYGALLWELAEENIAPKTTRGVSIGGGLTLWEMAEERNDAKMLRILNGV